MIYLCLFSNDAPTTEIYTLSLHDALPILLRQIRDVLDLALRQAAGAQLAPFACENTLRRDCAGAKTDLRSEEHTSELQSQSNLVCRLLLEKKKEQQRTLEPDFLEAGTLLD